MAEELADALRCAGRLDLAKEISTTDQEPDIPSYLDAKPEHKLETPEVKEEQEHYLYAKDINPDSSSENLANYFEVGSNAEVVKEKLLINPNKATALVVVIGKPDMNRLRERIQVKPIDGHKPSVYEIPPPTRIAVSSEMEIKSKDGMAYYFELPRNGGGDLASEDVEEAEDGSCFILHFEDPKVVQSLCKKDKTHKCDGILLRVSPYYTCEAGCIWDTSLHLIPIPAPVTVKLTDRHSSFHQRETANDEGESTSALQDHQRDTVWTNHDVDLPTEIEKLDPSMIEMYIKALREGKEKQNTIRVMIVGHFGVGKTTLTKNLLGMPLPVDEIESTNGIDVHQCWMTPDVKWKIRENTSKDKDTFKRLVSVASSLKVDVSVDAEDRNATGNLNHDKPEKRDTDMSDIEKKSQDDTNNGTATLSKNEDREKESKLSDSLDLDTRTSNLDGENSDKYKMSNLLQFSSVLKEKDTSNLNKPINIWDFGGQFIFYATHQLFHTRKAVYLLVLDMSKDLDEPVDDEDFPEGPMARVVKSFCKFWLHSIHSCVGTPDGEPPVILVGTHEDKLNTEEESKSRITEEYFDNVRKLFDKTPVFLKHIQPNNFSIDNFSGDKSSLEELRSYIVKIAESQKSRNQEIPAKWIPLENSLMERKNEKHVSFEEVCRIDGESDVPIEDQELIRLFLTYHHLTGTLVYFNEEGVSDFVVLDPQWIIDAFKCIVTSKQFCKVRPELRSLWDKLKTEAKLYPKLIEEVWSDNTNGFFEHKDTLLEYLKKLGIISKVSNFNVDTKQRQELDYYIVPSLLRCHSSQRVVDDFLQSRKSTVTCLVFDFQNYCVPPAIYHRITAAALGTWSVLEYEETNLLFENVGVYKLDVQHAGIIEVTDRTIDIRVVNLCGDVVNCRESDRLRRFVEMVLKHEFERFDPKREKQYKLCVRCNIGNKPGNGLEELDTLKKCEYSTAPCPDKTAGHNIDVKAVFEQWFPDKIKAEPDGIQAIGIVDVLKHENSKTLEKKLTEKVALKMSRLIGRNWELLGLSLGILCTTIEQIKEDYRKSTKLQIFHMLNAWMKENDDEATLEVLLRAMEKESDVLVEWDAIKNMLDQFPF